MWDLCRQHGILINYDKSHLSPTQADTYLGMVIKSCSLKAFLSPERVPTFLSQLNEFVFCLLGCLSYLCLLVPGGCLRLRSLQLALRNLWDLVDESVAVVWTPSNESDLLWWSNIRKLLAGVSLEPQHQDLLFWSDGSDQGWGANLMGQFISGRWSVEECTFLINLRELRAICLGLHHFQHSLQGHLIGVFSDNTTAVSYIWKQGGHFHRLSTTKFKFFSVGRSSWAFLLCSSSSWGRRMSWQIP